MKTSFQYLTLILSFVLSISCSYSQEICNNGIDDDGDGLIDLNDTVDCSCINLNLNTTNSSLIPNPSFENHTCCPTTYSELYCANNWVQATEGTSDYYNTCGYTPPTTPFPIPDGNGFAALIATETYREYLGACLTSPMISGQEYTLSFSIASVNSNSALLPCAMSPISDIDFTIYGLSACDLPTNIGVGDCPSNFGWTILGSATYTPSVNWGVLSIVFTPAQNINSIILGPPCSMHPSYNVNTFTCFPYFFLDNLLLNYSGPIDISLNQSGFICNSDLTLQASSSASGGTWQWYFDGVALSGETSSALSINSNGNQAGLYTVRYSQGGMCGTENTIISAVPCGLPIELTGFEVNCSKDEVVVNWKTLSEKNNDYFELQFSETGFNFQSIVTREGAGNSSSITDYSHTLRKEEYSKGYYRLKQVDYNGDFQFSDIVFSECSMDHISVTMMDGHLVIKNYKKIYSCIVLDFTGKMLFNSPNYELFELDTMNSLYFIQIESDKGWSTHKLF